jgi:hypothetical protein
VAICICKSTWIGGEDGRSYDGIYNCKFVARFFYSVADIDSLASKKRQPVTAKQGEALAILRGGLCFSAI